MLSNQIRAIVRAQFTVMWNRMPRKSLGTTLFSAFFYLLWYGMVLTGAVALAWFLPKVDKPDLLAKILGIGLLIAFFYWQVIPVLLVSSGLSLDLKRLRVYPIPSSQLFTVETLLRLSTGVEVVVLLIGGMIGLSRNPLTSRLVIPGLLLYIVFNMLLSVGIRDLLSRLMARKGARELVVLTFVLLSIAPQFIIQFVSKGDEKKILSWYNALPALPWPWTVTSWTILSDRTWLAIAGLLLWTATAAAFGYFQFRRGLLFDSAAARSEERASESARKAGLLDWFFLLPSRLLPDPVGNLVEKEFRSLVRSPRFRLVFFMGFTFGILIWMPMVFGGRAKPGFFAENFLALVSLYAVLILGEVLFWNFFGFDREAAQSYFVMPVRLRSVIIAKNITAMVFLLLEVSVVYIVCLLLAVNIPRARVGEALLLTILMSLFLLAFGNLGSVYYARAVDPSDPWRRASSGKFQLLLLLIYPGLMLLMGLAYLARYAFESQAAFYGTLAVLMAVGAITYWVALDSACAAAARRRESLVSALSRSESPVG